MESLPHTTTPAGFLCPSCRTSIYVPADDTSKMAMRIRESFSPYSWWKRAAPIETMVAVHTLSSHGARKIGSRAAGVLGTSNQTSGTRASSRRARAGREFMFLAIVLVVLGAIMVVLQAMLPDLEDSTAEAVAT